MSALRLRQTGSNVNKLLFTLFAFSKLVLQVDSSSNIPQNQPSYSRTKEGIGRKTRVAYGARDNNLVSPRNMTADTRANQYPHGSDTINTSWMCCIVGLSETSNSFAASSARAAFFRSSLASRHLSHLPQNKSQ